MTLPHELNQARDAPYSETRARNTFSRCNASACFAAPQVGEVTMDILDDTLRNLALARRTLLSTNASRRAVFLSPWR